MVVFVIGGAGFIGRRVVRTVAGYGHRVISLDIVVAPLFDAGRVVGFAGSAVDVTARRKAQVRAGPARVKCSCCCCERRARRAARATPRRARAARRSGRPA